MTQPAYGIMAEFRRPEDLIEAVRAARRAGYTKLDAFSPFPLSELADELGVRTTIIPWIAFLAALVGAGLQYGSQYWMNAVDYPLNVGGRPLDSWPAFIPSTLIVAILWAGAATLIGLLVILRLPRLHHPVFAVHGFRRASEDRFFLCILAEDPIFEMHGTRTFLETLSPLAVQEAPGMRLALGFIGLSLLAACDSGTEQRDAVASTRAVQRAYVPLPPGTIARGSAARQAALAPPGPAVTPELLARGEGRFRVFCTPCHGPSGRGDGTVVSRGFPPPPSYHDERLRAVFAGADRRRDHPGTGPDVSLCGPRSAGRQVGHRSPCEAVAG